MTESFNLDKTFCASPNCKNECERKLTPEQELYIKKLNHPWISYAYFCDETFLSEKPLKSDK